MTAISLASTRLTLRLGRFELLSFGGFIVGLSAVVIGVALWIDSLRPPAACFVQTDTFSAECERAMNAWYSAQGAIPGLAFGVVIFLSFAAGLFLGVPIVARELERGTSRLAWSLAPSRTRWFVARLVPVMVVLVVVTFVAGVAADVYVGATTSDPDLSQSFAGFGFRGLLVASRSLFIFAAAVAVGAIIGRVLPAVILTAVIATVGLAGGEAVHQRILAGEAVPIAGEQAIPGALWFDQRFQLPDGSLVGWEYFGFEGNGPYDDFGNPKYPMFSMVVPGERYRFVETREALVLAGGSLVALVLAAFVVTRRRPG